MSPETRARSTSPDSKERTFMPEPVEALMLTLMEWSSWVMAWARALPA